MVIIGLFFDQNHGFLWQNPLHFIGLFMIGRLFYYDKFFTLLWMLIFFSLLIPNGLHPNWYGGGSFAGQFAWSSAVLFIIPTLYGLLMLGKVNPRLFNCLVFLVFFGKVIFFFSIRLFRLASIINCRRFLHRITQSIIPIFLMLYPCGMT
jgi:hypothetical protein